MDPSVLSACPTSTSPRDLPRTTTNSLTSCTNPTPAVIVSPVQCIASRWCQRAWEVVFTAIRSHPLTSWCKLLGPGPLASRACRSSCEHDGPCVFHFSLLPPPSSEANITHLIDHDGAYCVIIVTSRSSSTGQNTNAYHWIILFSFSTWNSCTHKQYNLFGVFIFVKVLFCCNEM